MIPTIDKNLRRLNASRPGWVTDPRGYRYDCSVEDPGDPPVYLLVIKAPTPSNGRGWCITRYEDGTATNGMWWPSLKQVIESLE